MKMSPRRSQTPVWSLLCNAMNNMSAYNMYAAAQISLLRLWLPGVQHRHSGSLSAAVNQTFPAG